MLKSRLIYLGIILVSFIFSQALYESVSFMTFVIVLVLPVISIFLALISYPLVSARMAVQNVTVYRLNDFLVRVYIKGVTPFISSSVKVYAFVPGEDGNDIKKTVFATIPNLFSRSHFDYKCKLVNRGVYELSVHSVEYYDFLKLIRIRKRIKHKINIKVLPRNIQVDVPVASEQYNQDNTFVIGDKSVVSGGDMVGVRDYVTGDNLKNVHWKLSSKSEELVMKAFAEDIFDRAYIILDMSEYYDDNVANKSMTDCVVETALCAINEYAKTSIRFGVLVSDGKASIKKYSVATSNDKLSALSAVSDAPVIKNTGIIDLLNNVDFNMISGSEVLIITSFKSLKTLNDIKKIFIDKKTSLNIINIVEKELADQKDIITYTRDYLENQIRGSL